MPQDSRLRALLAALAAVLAAGLTVAVVDNGPDHDPSKPRRTITITLGGAPDVPTTAHVDGPDSDGAFDDQVQVPPAAADRLEDQLAAGQAELADSLRQPADTPATTRVPGPLAADETPGCRTRFVGNSSSRGGVRPSLIFLHQTVSRERGWPSQDALTALAARRSSGVSWHYAIGRSNGLCTYTVPLALKAWTQANANPYAVSIEVEAYGDEGAYVVGAGKRKLVSVVRYVADRYDIPLRRGAVSTSTCRPVRSGIVEHSDAGPCGGGHVDVTLTPGDAAASIAAAARAAGRVSTADQVACRKLNWYRRAGRPKGGQSERNAVARRRQLEQHGVRCTSRGATRA